MLRAALHLPAIAVLLLGLTTHMKESPTKNPLKYIKEVNVKLIPVPADTYGGPASTKQLVPC